MCMCEHRVMLVHNDGGPPRPTTLPDYIEQRVYTEEDWHTVEAVQLIVDMKGGARARANPNSFLLPVFYFF